MLISELIAGLEKIKELEGNINVATVDQYGGVHTIYGLCVAYDDNHELRDTEEECDDEYADKVAVVIA